MNEDIKNTLSALFAQDKKKADMAAQNKFEQEERGKVNDLEFTRILDEIITPTLKEISEFVDAQGWVGDITSENEEKYRGDLISPEKISIVFFRGTKPKYYRDHEHPHFTMIHSPGSAGVSFYRSTIMPGHGGMAGSAGGALLQELTAEMIHERVADLLVSILKR